MTECQILKCKICGKSCVDLWGGCCLECYIEFGGCTDE